MRCRGSYEGQRALGRLCCEIPQLKMTLSLLKNLEHEMASRSMPLSLCVCAYAFSNDTRDLFFTLHKLPGAVWGCWTCVGKGSSLPRSPTEVRNRKVFPSRYVLHEDVRFNWHLTCRLHLRNRLNVCFDRKRERVVFNSLLHPLVRLVCLRAPPES